MYLGGTILGYQGIFMPLVAAPSAAPDYGPMMVN
jgi:hypothetical protein